MFNRIAILISLIIFTNALVGCASEQNVGYGTVIQQKKIANKDYYPKKGTLTGAGIGAGAGAVTGAYIGAAGGAAVGLIFSVGTLGFGAASIPAFAMAGAASGAAAGGIAGGVTGAGVGYAIDIHKQGIGVYQLTIKPDDREDKIFVTQYVQSPFPLHAHVRILWKDDHYYIEPA